VVEFSSQPVDSKTKGNQVCKAIMQGDKMRSPLSNQTNTSISFITAAWIKSIAPLEL
jgi:hypothetical protein